MHCRSLGSTQHRCIALLAPRSRGLTCPSLPRLPTTRAGVSRSAAGQRLRKKMGSLSPDLHVHGSQRLAFRGLSPPLFRPVPFVALSAPQFSRVCAFPGSPPAGEPHRGPSNVEARPVNDCAAILAGLPSHSPPAGEAQQRAKRRRSTAAQRLRKKIGLNVPRSGSRSSWGTTQWR
jgi:hypothetical protein